MFCSTQSFSFVRKWADEERKKAARFCSWKNIKYIYFFAVFSPINFTAYLLSHIQPAVKASPLKSQSAHFIFTNTKRKLSSFFALMQTYLFTNRRTYKKTPQKNSAFAVFLFSTLIFVKYPFNNSVYGRFSDCLRQALIRMNNLQLLFTSVHKMKMAPAQIKTGQSRVNVMIFKTQHKAEVNSDQPV